MKYTRYMEESTILTTTALSGQTEVVSNTETTSAHETEWPTTNQILSWVWVQILNLIIFFVIFWSLMWKSIIKWFEDRKNLMKKLDNAEDNYKKRIEDAECESKKIIQEGLKRKDDIISEAGSLASQRKDEIIDEAHQKAERLLDEAKKKNENLKVELENNFAKGVKQTSATVLNKLLWKDKSIKSDYLDEVVNEVVK